MSSPVIVHKQTIAAARRLNARAVAPIDELFRLADRRLRVHVDVSGIRDTFYTYNKAAGYAEDDDG